MNDSAKRLSFAAPLLAGTTVMRSQTSQVIWRPFGMDAWIVNATTSGSGRVNRGVAQFECGRGELLLFPPGVPHDYGKAQRDGTWTHVWVYFVARATWLERLRWPHAAGGVLRLVPKDAGMFKRIVKRLQEVSVLLRTHHRNRLELAMNALEEALLWCDGENPDRRAVTDSRIERALMEVRERYFQAVSVEQLAHVAALSPSRFAHLFASQVGMSPMQYLQQVRLTAAQELLIGSDRAIGDIAAAVGFDNPLYFSRVFRKRFGASPRKFRTRAAR